MLEENERVKLLLGDFRVVGKQIPDNSIDLIFTDFPYTNKYIHLLEPFAEFSKRVLKEQGMMLTYMGVYFLDQALETICKYLTYHWQLVIRYAGPRPMLYAYRIANSYRPILWFRKGKVKTNKIILDSLVKGSYEGKEFHKWQQSVKEALFYMRRLIQLGDIICDPFMGSGTTGLAAKQLDCKFIGIEIDPETFRIAEKRIRETGRNYNLSEFSEVKE